jgi:hypothetical protein
MSGPNGRSVILAADGQAALPEAYIDRVAVIMRCGCGDPACIVVTTDAEMRQQPGLCLTCKQAWIITNDFRVSVAKFAPPGEVVGARELPK